MTRRGLLKILGLVPLAPLALKAAKLPTPAPVVAKPELPLATMPQGSLQKVFEYEEIRDVTGMVVAIVQFERLRFIPREHQMHMEAWPTT